MNKYYGYKYQERLDSSLDEFMERVMEDSCEKIGEGDEAILNRMEAEEFFPIKCHVYKQMELPSVEDIAKDIIERTLEDLDCNYSTSRDEATDPTQAMKDAALAFAKVIREEYKPYDCDDTGEVIELNRKDFE